MGRTFVVKVVQENGDLVPPISMESDDEASVITAVSLGYENPRAVTAKEIDREVWVTAFGEGKPGSFTLHPRMPWAPEFS